MDSMWDGFFSEDFAELAARYVAIRKTLCGLASSDSSASIIAFPKSLTGPTIEIRNGLDDVVPGLRAIGEVSIEQAFDDLADKCVAALTAPA
jgi:hypothetical protein